MRKRVLSLIVTWAVLLTVSVSGQEFTAETSTDPAKMMSPAEVEAWRSDLVYLAHTLSAKHANLFHRLEREKFDSAVESLNERIPRLTSQQVALEMARIVGLARDGHTYLSTIWDPKLKFQFYPIRFYVFSDGVYVTYAAEEYKELVGARLTGVEAMSAKAAIDKIGPYLATDNKFGIYESVPYYLASPSVLHAIGISPKADATNFEFEKDGKRVEVTAKLDPAKDNSITATLEAAPKWLDVRAGTTNPKPLTYKRSSESLWFEYVKDKKMLFVQMNNVLDDENKTIEQFFAQVVAAAKQNNAEKLVLDLRHNGGGNNTLVRPIIRGLIQLENIDRRGKLFVIIGRRTFSAAQNLVNQLETWTNASFIGEPTGSHVNMYGDARTFNLPKSGLRLRISELFWQNKHARDERAWTSPHFAAEPNFSDYVNNIDPAMKAIESFESRPTLDELAMKRYATMDLAGFRGDAIAFKNDPANKYVDIEGQINRYGYNMIQMKQWDAAIGLFKINVELYPDSWNVYDSLAEAYMLKGEMETAAKLYMKSLELNPDNSNAVDMLKRIQDEAKETAHPDH
ncbi:MAG: S41 family peptidase [Acidobacteriota bacterium]|nr:S41 family peptidase [Acidobacteriota bacterium]MDH3529881.1 S41 family peptidase [Acidobacteriota bacterium]